MGENIKYILNSITLGLLAALSIYLCIILKLPAWVLFIGWSSYSLFCSTKAKAVAVLIEETLGMLLAYVINILGVFLSYYLSSFGLLLSVFLIVSMLYWVTKLKLFNNIITYFLGMTVWFSYKSDTLADLPLLILSLFLGICFGYAYSTLERKVSKTNLKIF